MTEVKQDDLGYIRATAKRPMEPVPGQPAGSPSFMQHWHVDAHFPTPPSLISGVMSILAMCSDYARSGGDAKLAGAMAAASRAITDELGLEVDKNIEAETRLN